MQSPSLVSLIIRLQDCPDEDLDVAAALAKRPTEVRAALIEAILQVHLSATETLLLRLENIFKSALQAPWKEPKALRSVLEACRCGKIKAKIERLFYEHGKEYAIIALALATNPDTNLFYEIEKLPREEQIQLVEHVVKNPKKKVIAVYEEAFKDSPGELVSDPPPQLRRPRIRKQGEKRNGTLAGNSQSSSPRLVHPKLPDINQDYKRQKISSGIDHRDNQTRESLQDLYPRKSPPYEVGLSTQHQSLSALQSHSRLPEYIRSNDYRTINCNSSKLVDSSQTSSGSKTGPQYRSRLIDFETDAEQPPFEPPQSQISAQEDMWNVSEDFIPGRPATFPQHAQMPGQEDEWDVSEDFIPGRPAAFPQHAQMPGQEELWNVSEDFIPGRPAAFPQQMPVPGVFVPDRPPAFPQHTQMPAQEDMWDVSQDFIPGRPAAFPLQSQMLVAGLIVPGRPPVFDPQQSQMQGRNHFQPGSS